MRNLRKFMAAVLAVALVLTSMTAVFAADSATIANADKAVALKDLGLYAGQDANDPTVGLENALTTQDSLIFLAKLFGYNDAANELSADQVANTLAKFDDAASISDYAKNVVAYSAANGILSGSTQNGKFFVGAKDTVTAARFATFMLKQMGYTVADYKVSVAQLAEVKGSKVDATLAGDLTRDDAVGVMYGTLTAEKASGKTVIADIVGDNADLKAKAEKLGLLEVAPVVTDDLAVVSVKALNTKQIEVVFNQEMDEDSAEDEGLYKIEDKGETEIELSDKSCDLKDDKKTVIITLDKSLSDHLTNASTATVTIDKDIMAVNEKTLDEDKEFEVEVQDGIIPTVTEVKATGEKTIKVTFSEPVYQGSDNPISTSNFAVKSGTYTYYVSSADLDLNVINLTLGTKLIEGPITVTVNDAGLNSNDVIQDYAGYKVFKGDHKFDYVKDTSVAVVTVKEAKKDHVTLAFSKPVKGTKVVLYHSAKNATNYASAEVNTNGKYVDEIEFKFDKDDKPVPAGTVTFYLVNDGSDSNKLVDGYGIKVPDQTLTANVELDVTGPTVSSKKVEDNTAVKFTFSESLNPKTVEKSDFTFKSVKNGKTVYFTISMEKNDKVVKLNVPGKLDDNTEYEVVIKKTIEDTSGNEMENDYVYTFTTGDNGYPEVDKDGTYAVYSEGKIYIKYKESMNESQMLDKDNYRVSPKGDGNYREIKDGEKISKISDKMVCIDLDEVVNNPSVKIAPISDLAGKKLGGKDLTNVEVKNIGQEEVTIKSAELIEKDKVKIVFNKEIKSIKNPDFFVSGEGITTSSSLSIASVESTSVNDDGNTEAIFTLDKEINTDATFEGEYIYISTVSDDKDIATKSVSGTKLKAEQNVKVEDKTAPEVAEFRFEDGADKEPRVVINNFRKKAVGNTLGDVIEDISKQYDELNEDETAEVIIYFTEKMAKSSLSKYTFVVDGFTVTGYDLTSDGKGIILYVKAKGDNTAVYSSVTQAYNISDANDNIFASGTTWTIQKDLDKEASETKPKK